MSWLLEVNSLHKWYTDREEADTPALTDISFQVAEGEFVSIVGPSGVGKTTLLKIVAGLEPPSRGEIRLRGQPVTGPPPEMILVFQDYARSLLPWRTVLRNVTFGLEFRDREDSRGRVEKARDDASARGKKRTLHLTRLLAALHQKQLWRQVSEQTRHRARDARADASEALAITGLTAFEDYYPWQLSGGMQQRVAIARALACRPAIHLMDEPFGSLDALTRAELEDHLLRLWAALGLTVLFVTHDIDEAVYLSDRVLVLRRQEILASRRAQAAGCKRFEAGNLGPETCGARLVGSVRVDLPRPRDQLTTREDPAFLACRHRLYELIGRSGVEG